MLSSITAPGSTVRAAEPAWGNPRLEMEGQQAGAQGEEPWDSGPSGTPYPQFCSASRLALPGVCSPREQPLTLGVYWLASSACLLGPLGS